MLAALELSIKEAQSYLGRIGGFALVHTESVVGLALELVGYYPSVDCELIEVAAWWHDAGRLHHPNHEELSAQMADASLASLGVPAEDRRIVFNAIAFHKWSMNPPTIEGEIVRDADKLDWVTVSRWTSLMEEGRTETLRNFAESLGSIRNELLHLEPSRPLFDRTFNQLFEYVRNTELPGLESVVALVFEHASRTDKTQS